MLKKFFDDDKRVQIITFLYDIKLMRKKTKKHQLIFSDLSHKKHIFVRSHR